jgi:hypothetical protein
MKSTVIDQDVTRMRALFRQLAEAFSDHPSIIRAIDVAEDDRPNDRASMVPSWPCRDSSELEVVEVTIRIQVPRVLIPALDIRTR